MNPSSSKSQDEKTSTSDALGMRILKQLPVHDIDAFGLGSELSDLKLPTTLDVLRYYFYLVELAKVQSKVHSYKIMTPYVTDRLTEIWDRLDLPITTRKDINVKLNGLIDKLKNAEENKAKPGSTFPEFVQSTKELFYIGKCKCDLKAALCSCKLIPARLKEFMRDQFNERKLTIPEYEIEIVEQVPAFIPTIPIGEDSEPEEAMEQSSRSRRGPRTPRFAMVCNRFGVHDEVASALATALFKDIGFRDNLGNSAVMGKADVRREKDKCRTKVIRRQCDDSSLLAFSFDGRKDDALTREKIHSKYHTIMVKEPHLVILKEPQSQLLGYIKVEKEDSEHKAIKLNEFFISKEISLDALIGICCDGEPANTDVHNGIIRQFEKQLKIPLHWFVCLLHFNEIPFRLLFDTLEESTTGLRSTTRKLSKQIETCENLPVVADFEQIKLENMPPASDKIEFSTDSKYLYDMANAVSNGEVPDALSHIKPGPILNSCGLTKASRLLRLYVATENPSDNFKILATYIMKVYTPMYFSIKYYSSVVYGSVLFYKFILWTRDLESRLLTIVNNVITDNAYFAHSENILLSMLFDDRKEKRNIAIKKILHYRSHVEDPLKLRVYTKPSINFNCTDYTNMIDLNDNTTLFEPPFTRTIPYDCLSEYLKKDDRPLNDPQIPLHIQGTEKHVQLLSSASKRVLHESRGGSCEKLPRLESKKGSRK